MERQPVILLVTTLHLDKTARLAIALAEMDCKVVVLCPAGHWVRFTRRVRRRKYSAMRPLDSLWNAINTVQPDFILPCDDRAVRHLHMLHRSTRDPVIRGRIEHSLGPPESFKYTEARLPLLVLAREEGVLVPDAHPIHSATDLSTWSEKKPLPWVMKADGSWAGMGVRIVSNLAEAQTALRDLSQSANARMAISQALFEWDFFWLFEWLARTRPKVSIQEYITGTSANCALACWHGEVLAGVAVEALATESRTGPATVVRVVNGATMLDAAKSIVKALRVTGMVGFDFVIEQTTGKEYLIEMNPRAVPLCHLALGPDRDLAQALVAQLTGSPRTLRGSIPRQDLIAYFPDAFKHDPVNPALASGYHDVPWNEPELLGELLKANAAWRSSVLRASRRLRKLRQGLDSVKSHILTKWNYPRTLGLHGALTAEIKGRPTGSETSPAVSASITEIH